MKPWVPIRPWCTRTCSTGAQWPHHGDMQAFVLPTLTSSLQGLLGTREQAARDAPGPTFRCSQQPQNRWPERAHHHRNQEHPVVFATRVCVVLGLNLWENTIQAYFANLVTLFSGGLQKLFKIQLAVVQNTSVCGCECLHTQTPKHPNQQGCWNDDVTGAKTGINQNITFFPYFPRIWVRLLPALHFGCFCRLAQVVLVL